MNRVRYAGAATRLPVSDKPFIFIPMAPASFRFALSLRSLLLAETGSLLLGRLLLLPAR